MNVDFSIILALLSLVSGLAWLLGVLFFSDKKQKDEKGRLILAMPFDVARSFFPIFVIVLLLRSFVVEPFKIPTGSMMPTLLIGDFILVNKYEYGIRLPIINLKIIDNKSPKRGDIVVFRYPKDPSKPYIKRVIGLPGDRYRYHNKTLSINGKVIEQSRISTYEAQGSGKIMDGANLSSELLTEKRHDVLHLLYRNRTSPFDEGTVPKGHYFVLGDNRDNSQDSRYWGYVPEQNLMGRAFMVWMNWDGENSGIININWERIGTMLNNM